MKPPIPYNQTPMQSAEPDQDDSGMQNFAQNTDFLQKVHNTNFPHKGAGTHIPMWLSPALAKQVMIQHGRSGHAIPHPNINLQNLTK